MLIRIPATGALIGFQNLSLAGETILGATGLAHDPMTGQLFGLLKLQDPAAGPGR